MPILSCKVSRDLSPWDFHVREQFFSLRSQGRKVHLTFLYSNALLNVLQ